MIKILGVNHMTDNNPCGFVSWKKSYITLYASIFIEGDPRMVQWLINNGGNDVKECLRK